MGNLQWESATYDHSHALAQYMASTNGEIEATMSSSGKVQHVQQPSIHFMPHDEQKAASTGPQDPAPAGGQKVTPKKEEKKDCSIV